MQFRPEVAHIPDGARLPANFTKRVADCAGDWTMAAFREQAIAKIRAQVGTGRVVCGLSGGVDSSVAAVLIHEAIGGQLTCIFVDHGLLRAGEAAEVVTLFRDHDNIPLIHRDARELFLGELGGVSDPGAGPDQPLEGLKISRRSPPPNRTGVGQARRRRSFLGWASNVRSTTPGRSRPSFP